MSTVNVTALKKVATRLRRDVPCQGPALEALRKNDPKAAEILADQTGGQNCHLDVVFNDGTTWLARFRFVNDPTLPPETVADYIFLSEVASMFDLAGTKVAAPKVFHYARKNDKKNEVGLTFLLMEKLPGKSLDWNSASSAQKFKIMEQLADVFLEIERHPY